jgi:RecA/RadA recombinase
LSFLQREHFFAFVDAEFSTPSDWLNAMFASQMDNPAFVAIRPKSYESTVDAVRSLARGIESAKEKGELSRDTTALVVVDSFRKLVPEDFMAKIAKLGAEGAKGSIDGMSGRGAMIKAKMNGDWLDELTPLLYHTGTAMLAIAREFESQDPNGPSYKMGGGKAMEYDASIVARVTREWVRVGSGEDAEIVGERHVVGIRKSKVAGMEDRVTHGYFHTSNGKTSPEGFDRARDVVELGRELGVVKSSEGGGWLSWRASSKDSKVMRWQGVGQAVRKLNDDPGLMQALEAAVRAAGAPTRTDPETGEVKEATR